jgi:hypothetical protein
VLVLLFTLNNCHSGREHALASADCPYVGPDLTQRLVASPVLEEPTIMPTLSTAALRSCISGRQGALNDFAASLYAFVAYITHGSLNQGADFVLRLVTESTAALTTGDGKNLTALLADDVLEALSRAAGRSQRN